MKTSGKKLSETLATLVQQGLAHADKALVVDVAKALWYSSELPDLATIAPAYRKDACYVVDRLSRFNVLPKNRKLELLATLEQFKKMPASSVAATTNQDPLAISWGASADLTQFMPDLLPFQTRHYAAMQAG